MLSGRVHVNGVRVKPAKELAVGDTLEPTLRSGKRAVQVAGLSDKRGPAAAAATLYAETPESIAARERETLRTRPRLRQAVRDARRLLGDAIAGERECYWLDRACADVDLDELERLLAASNTAQPEHAQVLMESALQLFRGEPLAGSDYPWSQSQVPRLRATLVELLEQVGRHRLQAGDARAALQAAERGLEVDGLNESLWRLAMEAESALGLREAVSERFERLRALLDERLGLVPAQETRHLHLRLLAQT